MTYEIPLTLNVPTFLKSWEDWLADRKERKKAVTTRAAKIQLGKLESMGVKRAVAAIENSIEKGYQGIFESQQGNFKSSTAEDPNKVDY